MYCQSIVMKTGKPCNRVCKTTHSQTGLPVCGLHAGPVECSICLTSITNRNMLSTTSPCKKCINKWMVHGTTCPNCRTPITQNEDEYIQQVLDCWESPPNNWKLRWGPDVYVYAINRETERVEANMNLITGLNGRY